MKTNIGIETTDEEREQIAATLGLKHKLATRNDIKEAINEYVQNVLIGGSDADLPEAGGHRRDLDDDGSTGDQGLPVHDNPIASFTPSRGDEPYLLKARDPELRDILSRMLDVSEEYDQYVWRKHEENRRKE